jgi:CheY-like chemotaxis protein
MTAVRVLHVEDESDIREVVEISLSLDPDFVTRSCSSGNEALEVAEDWPPDIILLDVMMPVMDGPATLARLRGNTKTADIPVVFMTARAQARELDLFHSLGIVGVIPKPFDPMTLANSVRAFVQPVEERFDALRIVFLQRVANDAAVLVKLRCTLKDGKAATVAMTRINEIAHGLAGVGGIFGYPDISDAAAAVEQAILIGRDGSGSDQAIVRALGRLLICIDTRCHRKQPSRSKPDA